MALASSCSALTVLYLEGYGVGRAYPFFKRPPGYTVREAASPASRERGGGLYKGIGQKSLVRGHTRIGRQTVL